MKDILKRTDLFLLIPFLLLILIGTSGDLGIWERFM